MTEIDFYIKYCIRCLIPVLLFANELNHVAYAKHELILDERHPRIIVEFDHGARIEEVEVADLRRQNSKTIALRISK